MYIVHVYIHVRPERVDEFIQATLANASNSVLETGIARFDVLQEADDRTKFILVEVYRTPEAAGSHKETEHYLRWRDTVAEMMADPRKGVKYANLYPSDDGW